MGAMLTPVSSISSTSSTSSTSSSSGELPEFEQKPDYVAAGRGVGGKLHLGVNSLTAEGGTGYGAEMTLEELLFLRKKAGGDVTVGGGVGLGAKLHGVRAEMEKDKALQKEGK